MTTAASLPTDSKHRKTLPMATGVLDYFPAALAEVARLSRAGNDKHNPGQPMHHARGKSSDHADCILRHLTDRGQIDPEDGFLHDVKIAWRALALLQEALEARGAPLARGARLPAPPVATQWRQAIDAVFVEEGMKLAQSVRDACEWPACPECSDATGVPCE